MADNQFSVRVPSIYEALLAGDKGYDSGRQFRQDQALQAAGPDFAAGNYQGALAKLMQSGNLQGAMLANQLYQHSPAGIAATETAKQEVAQKYAPKTTNIKTADGQEITVEKGPNGYKVVPVQGMTGPAPGAAPIPPGVDPKKYRETLATKNAEIYAKKPDAEAHLNDAYANLDRLKAEATALKNDPNVSRMTGLMGVVPSVPGFGAANAEARLEALKSQVGFAVLQAMRNASKTGGVLGQVSDRENTLLQSNLAALSTKQSPEQFKKSLGQIIDYVEGAKGRLKSAYDTTYAPFNQGAQSQGATSAPPQAAAALKANPALREQYEAKYGPGSAAQVLGQ